MGPNIQRNHYSSSRLNWEESTRWRQHWSASQALSASNPRCITNCLDFSSFRSQRENAHKFTKGTCSVLTPARDHHSKENTEEIPAGRRRRQGRGINSLMISPGPPPRSGVTESSINGDTSSLRIPWKSNADTPLQLLISQLPLQQWSALTSLERAKERKKERRKGRETITFWDYE